MPIGIRVVLLLTYILGSSLLAVTAYAEVICNSKSVITNVRNGPTANGTEIVVELQNGDKVTVLDKVVNDKGFEWFKVEAEGLQDTVIGYVSSQALAESCGGEEKKIKAPVGMCFYVMKIVDSKFDAAQYIAEHNRAHNSEFEIEWSVAYNKNESYSVTIGPVDKNEFEETRTRLVNSNLSPSDAECVSGEQFSNFETDVIPEFIPPSTSASTPITKPKNSGGSFFESWVNDVVKSYADLPNDFARSSGGGGGDWSCEAQCVDESGDNHHRETTILSAIDEEKALEYASRKLESQCAQTSALSSSTIRIGGVICKKR